MRRLNRSIFWHITLLIYRHSGNKERRRHGFEEITIKKTKIVIKIEKCSNRLGQSVSFKTIIQRRPYPEWKWGPQTDSENKRGGGKAVGGSCGDGADVNHFHHWFTRTQHGLSAHAAIPFIYTCSSTFLFGVIKKNKNVRTHTGTCLRGITFCRGQICQSKPAGRLLWMHSMRKMPTDDTL